MNVIPTWFKALLIGALIGLVLHKIYEAGAETERSKWLLKTTLQTVSNQTELAKKNRDLRVLESRIAAQAVEISTFYRGVYEQKLAEKDRILSAVRTGNQRLSIPITSTAAACAGGISLSPGNRPGTTETPRAELSTEAAEFLIELGADCDAEVIHANEVKDHLAACRAALDQQQLILKKE